MSEFGGQKSICLSSVLFFKFYHLVLYKNMNCPWGPIMLCYKVCLIWIGWAYLNKLLQYFNPFYLILVEFMSQRWSLLYQLLILIQLCLLTSFKIKLFSTPVQLLSMSHEVQQTLFDDVTIQLKVFRIYFYLKTPTSFH